MAASVTQKTLDALVPVIARISIEGKIYQPDHAGHLAYLIPVRVDQALTPEAADPAQTVRRGGIVDLVAPRPAHPLSWVLRLNAAEWLGTIEPQYLDPDPIHLWRSPLSWLRAGCRGLVILSRQQARAYRSLAGCRGPVIAEDGGHPAELRSTLFRPWPMPQILFPAAARHAGW